MTGGTFSCVGTDRGLMPRSGDEQAEKMLSLMPDIIENYDITPLVLMNIDSSDMTVKHHKMIADAIDANIDKYDGIVMTHGTDTMAYTAAALSVMLRNPPIPIVLTGSQRPFFDENSDAPKNFADAFEVSDKAVTGGIVVVFGGRIMRGCDCVRSTRSPMTLFVRRPGTRERSQTSQRLFPATKICRRITAGTVSTARFSKRAGRWRFLICTRLSIRI